MSDDNDDLFAFVFDKNLRDSENDILVSVTVVDPDSDVQLRFKSGSLEIPVFLEPRAVRLLAQYLLQACDAREIPETD